MSDLNVETKGAEDAPAAPQPDPTPPGTVESVTLTVAPEHADLLQRAIAVIEKGGQFVLDNIEAGVAALEAYLTPADDTKTAPEPDSE